MATATTTTTTEAFRGCCSLCLTQLSATPTKQAALAPTFLRQLIDLLGFDVALPLCDGCHGDVISVIDIIRQMNKLQKALGLGVVGITKKKKVITVLVTASLDGVAMSSEAETLIIAPQPAVKMKQEDIEEWNTSEIPSDWILSSNVTAQPPPTMGHFLEPFSPSATTSKQGNNCPKDDDQDPDVSGDETGSSSPDDDDDRGDDKIRPSDSPSLPPTTSTPGQAKEKRPGLAAKFPGWQKLITTLSLKPPLFQCNACSKKFKTKSNIKYHQFCGNADSEKPFKCDQCDKGFISKSHYEYHLRTHTGERPYPCSECDKSFNQKSKLTRHMGAVHDGKKEKRFVCDLCGAGFITKGKLQSHDVTHTGQKLFPCKHCGKRYLDRPSLRKHEITHTGGRPHVCSQCGKNFAHKVTLDTHMRTHSDVRPYECDQCTAAFHDKKDLNRHALTHTDERPFKCDFCVGEFRRKDGLQRHIKNIHIKGKNKPNLKDRIQTNSSVPELKFDSADMIEELVPKSEVESDVSDNDDPLNM
ncbi:zinc finger protein 599 [Folsomia candida]|uniref:zinc finger protein 599 n=1 Tax=Folsomia candida TaxID=158441 RepID=UPI000B8F429B|nr:zinc finger protein 599 [Folsomia candida]